MTAGLTFRELLDYTGSENERWRDWFASHPEVLEQPYAAPPLATVRQVVRHVAFVEHRYATFLAGGAPPAPSGTDQDDAATLFAYLMTTRRQFEEAIEREGDWTRTIEFMTLTIGAQRASARKLVGHALMHGVRHWAQLATVLRERGTPTDWPHDLLVSGAMR